MNTTTYPTAPYTSTRNEKRLVSRGKTARTTVGRRDDSGPNGTNRTRHASSSSRSVAVADAAIAVAVLEIRPGPAVSRRSGAERRERGCRRRDTHAAKTFRPLDVGVERAPVETRPGD